MCANIYSQLLVVLLIVCAISYLLFPVPQLEVAECRRDVPTVLSSSVIKPGSSPSQPTPMDISDTHQSTSSSHHPTLELSTSADTEMEEGGGKGVSGDGEGGERAEQCIPEQAALIKSILNFLKKAIPEPMFAESIRNRKQLESTVYMYIHTYIILVSSRNQSSNTRV